MADTDIIVSEMTQASQINTGDLMIMTQPDAQAETGYTTKSGTVQQVANKMLKGTDYATDLPDFTDQSVLGGMEELKSDIKSLLPIDTASGNPCNFDTDIADNLVSCKATLVATGGNGSPSTPIAINGYSAVNLVHCGKNICSLTGFTHGLPSLTTDDSIDNIIESTRYAYKTLPMKDHSAITLQATTTDSVLFNYIFVFLYSGGKMVSYSGKGVPFDTWTINTSTADTIRIVVGANAGEIVPTDLTSYGTIQCELGSTATPYSPYNGTTHTISLGDIYYGGVLDVKNGKLTVTHKAKIYNGSEDWTTTTTNDGTKYRPTLNADMSDGVMPTTTTEVLNVLCNMFEGKTAVQTYECIEGISWQPSGSWRIYTLDYNTDDISLWKTFLSNNNLQIVYPLATPIEITGLTPVQISALLGVNNISSDVGGVVEVSYREGIQHYIDKKIAQTQALIL